MIVNHWASQPRRFLSSTYWHLHAVAQVARVPQVLSPVNDKVSIWNRIKRKAKMLAIAEEAGIGTYTHDGLSSGLFMTMHYYEYTFYIAVIFHLYSMGYFL